MNFLRQPLATVSNLKNIKQNTRVSKRDESITLMTRLRNHLMSDLYRPTGNELIKAHAQLKFDTFTKKLNTSIPSKFLRKSEFISPLPGN